jgi:predicted AAA+ superfamily ATPase
MQRYLYNSLIEHLEKKPFSIITGARQTGKSTLLREMESYCRRKNIPNIYISLEDISILEELNKSPLNLLPYLPDSEQRVVVFIDEIQYLQNPSNFIKHLYDEYVDKIKLVATGSSAFYIDQNFKDSLAGRKKIFLLPTCSFEEFLEMKGLKGFLDEINRIRNNEKAKSKDIILLQQKYEEYLLYGGYPAVITEENTNGKKDILSDIKDSFIKKDILESGIKNEFAFYNLFKIFALQSASLVNINELSKTLGITNETISNYLFVMQKCFHIVLVKPFYRNLRKELIKMPKAFLLDTGMRNCLLNSFQNIGERMDKGDVWETAYYKLLYSKYGQDNVFFWRTIDKKEVDFVLPNVENPFAVEVKFDKNAINTKKYRSFVEEYPNIPLSYAYFNPFDEDFFRRIA